MVNVEGKTPFIANARFRLEATIEPESGNTRANAIRYILLHELGHVVSGWHEHSSSVG